MSEKKAKRASILRFCSMSGCGGAHNSRGYCQKHYVRWKRHGDPSIDLKKMRRLSSCRAAGCPNDPSAHGYCRKHSRRIKLYGDPNRAKYPGDTPEERFWSRVDRSRGDSHCWEWSGRLIDGGRGQAYFKGIVTTAPRIAWKLKYGELPSGPLAQTCGNQLCCNPRHLKLKFKRTR